MVIRQATPFDFAPRSRRTRGKTTLIAAVSIAAHAAVAAYLAMMQFAAPKAPPTEPERHWDVEIYTPVKPPPPPEPDTKPQPKQVKFNQVLPAHRDRTDRRAHPRRSAR